MPDGMQMLLLLYASLHFQTCGILTSLISESARVSDFNPHDIFASTRLFGLGV